VQPSFVAVMMARGAVPLGYADMATAYPDLFGSARAAEMALKRENPTQTSIVKNYIIDVCVGFMAINYRRTSSRGPGGKLLYGPARVDPRTWRRDRLGAAPTGEAARRRSAAGNRAEGREHA